MRALRSVLGLLLLAAGGALAFVVATAVPATACSCLAGGPGAHLERSDVVFAGEVLERSRVSGQIDYRFAVDRVFKGEAGATTSVSTADQESACGLTALEDGVTYLVYAQGGAGDLGTSSCSGTRTVSAADLATVEEVVGPGRPPVGAEVTDAAGPLVAAAPPLGGAGSSQRGLALGLVGGGAAVVIAGGLLVGRLRTR